MRMRKTRLEAAELVGIDYCDLREYLRRDSHFALEVLSIETYVRSERVERMESKVFAKAESGEDIPLTLRVLGILEPERWGQKSTATVKVEGEVSHNHEHVAAVSDDARNRVAALAARLGIGRVLDGTVADASPASSPPTNGHANGHAGHAGPNGKPGPLDSGPSPGLSGPESNGNGHPR